MTGATLYLLQSMCQIKRCIYIYIMGTVKGDRKWNPKQAIKEKLKVGPEATCGESVTEI